MSKSKQTRKPKRLIPRAWMRLRDCCGRWPIVIYNLDRQDDKDFIVIHCKSCGMIKGQNSHRVWGSCWQPYEVLREAWRLTVDHAHATDSDLGRVSRSVAMARERIQSAAALIKQGSLAADDIYTLTASRVRPGGLGGVVCYGAGG